MDTPKDPQTKGKSKPILWVVLVAVIGVIAVGLYLYLQSSEPATNSNSVSSTNNANAANNRNVNLNSSTNDNRNGNTNAISNTNNLVDTSSWQSFSDSESRFSFKHPQSMQVRINSSTGEIEYRATNEWVSLFKVINGSEQVAVSWLNERPGVNVVYSKTDRFLIVAGNNSPIYSNGQYGNYAVASFPTYTLLVHIVDYLFPDQNVWSSIIASVTSE